MGPTGQKILEFRFIKARSVIGSVRELGILYEPQEELLQPRVLGSGLFVDRDIGVGVFPEGFSIRAIS